VKVRAARLALALLVPALSVPAAGRADATEASGERVRVATLLPFVEDALHRVTAPADVVATVRRRLHEAPVGGALDLGNPHSPSFERLAQARADLVVGDASLHTRLASQVERLGARMLLLETPSVEATFAELVRVGTQVGASESMREAVAEADAVIDSLTLARPVPTLALFGAPGSFFAFTERAWLGDLLTRLNFDLVGEERAGHERFPGLVALSDEVVARLAPELVVLVAHGEPEAIRDAFARRMADGGAWRSVRESAGGHVHVLDPEVFASNPGLDLPRAALALVALAPAPAGGGAPATATTNAPATAATSAPARVSAKPAEASVR